MYRTVRRDVNAGPISESHSALQVPTHSAQRQWLSITGAQGLLVGQGLPLLNDMQPVRLFMPNALKCLHVLAAQKQQGKGKRIHMHMHVQCT